MSSSSGVLQGVTGVMRVPMPLAAADALVVALAVAGTTMCGRHDPGSDRFAWLMLIVTPIAAVARMDLAGGVTQNESQIRAMAGLWLQAFAGALLMALAAMALARWRGAAVTSDRILRADLERMPLLYIAGLAGLTGVRGLWRMRRVATAPATARAGLPEGGTGVEVLATAPTARDRIRALPDRVAADAGALDLVHSPRDRFGDLAMPPPGLTRRQAMVKRAFDVVAAGTLLVLISPVLLLCAIAVKLGSPGPILFRQIRRGHRGSALRLLKFRGFYHAAADHGAARQTGRGNPRVMPVGVFLSRHSLDDLPQLLNVLRGDMSIVGPRPHALRMVVAGASPEELVPSYESRHRVKPGITGWAQVNGWRGKLDTPKKLVRRVEHDLYYIRNWSLLLDIQILLRTVTCLFHDPAAF